MLQKVLVVVLSILVLAFTGMFYWGDGNGIGSWLLFVVTCILMLFALGVALTFVLTKVPLNPFSLTFNAYAAEYFSAVKLFCFDAIRTEETTLLAQSDSNDDLPILFIHGFSCNSGFWRSYLRHFKGRWHSTIGTIDLEPLHGTIDGYADQIEQRVNQLLEASGKSKCLIVAHSMGGLATRSYLQQKSAHQKIKGVVTLGTPHSGTMMANLALAQNGHQMRRLSSWLEKLREQENLQTMPAFEALVGTHDNIVAPQECASYDLATNTYLNGMTHLAMGYDRQVIEWTFERLKRLQNSSETTLGSDD